MIKEYAVIKHRVKLGIEDRLELLEDEEIKA